MMEIIHVAPGTSQAFHTAFGGQASFAQGIIANASPGSTATTSSAVVQVAITSLVIEARTDYSEAREGTC